MLSPTRNLSWRRNEYQSSFSRVPLVGGRSRCSADAGISFECDHLLEESDAQQGRFATLPGEYDFVAALGFNVLAYMRSNISSLMRNLLSPRNNCSLCR